MAVIEEFDLEEVLDELGESGYKKGFAPGADIFKWMQGITKEIAKAMAIKHHLYVNDYIVSLLNQYRTNEHYFNKSQIDTYKKCLAWGVKIGDIRKIKIGRVKRLYFTPEGVNSVFQRYNEKGRLRDYKEENLEKELRKLVI